MQIGKLTLIFITSCWFSSVLAQKPYQDRSLPPEVRAEDLLGRLTLEEKASLMMNHSEAIPRLAIPQYDWWNEALHGVARNGTATVFPQAIGMAASFDDTLVYRVFTVVSDEARVKHRQEREAGVIGRYDGLTMWTPNINIFRDPRWGRGQETYGEDPYLTSRMGLAVVKGLQGEKKDGYAKLFACAKHYAVHSGPEWNRHSFNAENIAPRDLWETYLPAFKTTVVEGKVRQVMCAYNRFEGEPCCGSDQLLNQILRKAWGFEGIILSDCDAIDDFYKEGKHETHADAAHASADAIRNGTDLECGDSFKAIPQAVRQGILAEDQLNRPLKRLLTARFELGEIDQYSPWDALPDSLINCRAHQDLALEMARKSIVMLKNDGILPLSSEQTIALIGPAADDSVMQWGNYNGIPRHTVTLLEALSPALKNGVVDKIENNYAGDYESLISECSYGGEKGLRGFYWNNPQMKGDPVWQEQTTGKIELRRKRMWNMRLNMNNISAGFQGTFTPAESGLVQFVISSSCEVNLEIDGRKTELERIPKSLKVAAMEVEAGKAYAIRVEGARVDSICGFSFDILRKKDPDLKALIERVKDVDVVVFAGGISAELERESANVYAPGFMGGDRTTIQMPEDQRKMIAALKQAGKKVVLVSFSGSALGLEPESRHCDAILTAWYPGEAGGQAIADVLYGRYNPAGRLPVTFYKSVDQLPHFEDYNMKGRTYRFMEEKPLYPFGFGLSFTTFGYGQPVLSKSKINAGESVTLTVPVTNTGQVDGEEVAQVYIRKKNDPDGPVKSLRAFDRVHIAAGETVNIVFDLAADNLEWWDDASGSMKVHAGAYELMIGGSSRDEDLEKLTLLIE